MTRQLEIYEAALKLTGLATTAQLPKDGGFSAEIAAGGESKNFLDRGSLQVMPILILGKKDDQQQLMDTLFEVCNRLSKMKTFPPPIADISVGNSPARVGREDSGKWIWSCVLNVHFNLD